MSGRKTQQGRGGFTMIDMVMVCLIASILIGLGFQSGAVALDRMSLDSSRSALMALHARARARAIERGTTTRLFIDPVGDSAWVSDGAVLVERMDFSATRGTDVLADDLILLCMGADGVADTKCNSFASAVSITLARGGETTDLTLHPLGQVTGAQ